MKKGLPQRRKDFLKEERLPKKKGLPKEERTSQEEGLSKEERVSLKIKTRRK